MKQKGTREASHAYSWYDGVPDTLSNQLDSFLSQVPSSLNGSSLPIPYAKVVIAPYVLLPAVPLLCEPQNS